MLITIGGDDTAFSAMKLEERGRAASASCTCRRRSTTISICRERRHVRLPDAAHYGVEIVKNLMVDAKTTSRWYFVIAMGRKAATSRSASARPRRHADAHSGRVPQHRIR
jgi:6-phosphofructokinase 1